MSEKVIEIQTEEQKVGDPEITIYKITLKGEEGIWEETLGSEEQKDAFLRGIEALHSFARENISLYVNGSDPMSCIP